MEAKPKRYRGGLAPKILKRALEYIEAHLDDHCFATEIARELGLNPTYLALQFRISVGLPPHKYIIRRKIAIACERLRKNPDTKLVDLALNLGFSSQGHFSNVFHQTVGLSPTEFVEQYEDNEPVLVERRCKCPEFVVCPFVVECTE
jgi:AraC-like DNA-binding protein